MEIQIQIHPTIERQMGCVTASSSEPHHTQIQMRIQIHIQIEIQIQMQIEIQIHPAKQVVVKSLYLSI